MWARYFIHELTDINLNICNNISTKLTDLSEGFNEFISKYDKVYLELHNAQALTLIYLPGLSIRVQCSH